eukprot:TRINITY_DN2214_c1_g1_i1.p1 TRINITY_DN2214_c1_g1~~TRINITY_DN2214_c1_g1_i1.p1  ORF type:complete len:741 (-),score=129.72 TRINITY_DN2214_c1_g1_i1:2848-5070(-)
MHIEYQSKHAVIQKCFYFPEYTRVHAFALLLLLFEQQYRLMKKKIDANDEVYLTRTEVKKIERALKDPEFHKYWAEYLDELTDPAGRKEREEYMLEQEKQNDLPPNTHLVRPETLLCLKTYTRRLLSGQGPRKYVDQKLFINICISPHMEPPGKVDVVQNGQKMQSWSLPYTLSKPRPTKDNKGEVCMAVDIIFNTKCKVSIRFDEFKKMLCDTAIDAVNTFLKEYNEKASQNYKLLKKLKYKGGVPEFILMKKRPAEGTSALSENLKTDSHMPQLMKELYDTKEKTKAQTKEKEDKGEELDVDVTATEAVKEQKKARKKRRIKAYNEAPKYTITESHLADIGECFNGPVNDLNEKAMRKAPKGLVIRIELPGVRSTKNAKLELQEKRLKFQYLENYILDVPLPYYVKEGSAKAKYDKDKEVLRLEVEVDRTKSQPRKEEKQETGIVDLTNLKKTQNKEEEQVEVEKIEIPSLFNIYKPPTNEQKKEKNEEPKVEIKYKTEPEEEPELNTAGEVKEISEKPKTLITEVEKSEKPKAEQPKPEEQPVDYKAAPKVEGKYDFKQLGEFIILTYKVKGYQKETVTHKITNNEMLLEVYDPGLKAIQRTCVTLFLPVVAKESHVDLLLDFICVKLKKADSSKVWESLGYQISQLTEIPEKPKEPPQPESPVKEPSKPAEPEDRQNKMEQAEDALEQRQKRTAIQYVHLQSPMIFSIYQQIHLITFDSIQYTQHQLKLYLNYKVL